MYSNLKLYTLMQAWNDSKASDTMIHPVLQRATFVEDLLQEMENKNPKILEWPVMLVPHGQMC